jgi:hypothetical protein
MQVRRVKPRLPNPSPSAAGPLRGGPPFTLVTPATDVPAVLVFAGFVSRKGVVARAETC